MSELLSGQLRLLLAHCQRAVPVETLLSTERAVNMATSTVCIIASIAKQFIPPKMQIVLPATAFCVAIFYHYQQSFP